jgi:hypothetical protein
MEREIHWDMLELKVVVRSSRKVERWFILLLRRFGRIR